MPQVNLPLGLFGIFIPAYDPSIVVVPAIDPDNPSQGIWNKDVADSCLINLTRFLQQYAFSPNASLGGQYGANMLTGFDIVFNGPGGLTVTPQLFETNYGNGTQPNVISAGNNNNLVLQVKSQPVLPTPAGATSIIGWTLGFPPGTGYWLIGNNNADTTTLLQIGFSAAVILYGVNLYFGNK